MNLAEGLVNRNDFRRFIQLLDDSTSTRDMPNRYGSDAESVFAEPRRYWLPCSSGLPMRVEARPRRLPTATATRIPSLKQIGVGIIGTGWCGGIRPGSAVARPVVSALPVSCVRPQ